MSTSLAPWIILFAPLVAATLILFFGRYSKPLSAGLAIAAAALGAYLSWTLFLSHEPIEAAKFTWLSLPNFTVEIGVTIDQLSKVMLIVVTNIATLVFIYSIGYMDHEEGYWRYFGGLALFLFSMLGIVLADNLVMMFIFWELVGVSSYILIGHYYSKDSAADACKQAFWSTVSATLASCWASCSCGSPLARCLQRNLRQDPRCAVCRSATLTIGAILLFCGTIGKSAQLPLHVWLPNSMEGPTPVSSLLHAATMVAAGVYMLARIFPLLLTVDIARDVIAWVGGITCVVAALMATQQNDIKRILAYSTISQLGYMVLGAGVAPTADVPMFHLFTHAFFKCLLFLCSGSVILGMHHEQDIWKMGALKNKMPITLGCTLLGFWLWRVSVLQRLLQQGPHHRLGGG